MAIDPQLLEILACPKCKEDIKLTAYLLCCGSTLQGAC